MEYEWDWAKSDRNRAERGLPFEVAVPLFDGPTLETPDLRRNYGEARVIAVGSVRGVVLVCVYTDRRPGVRRIISLRLANRKERDAYRQAYPL